MLRLTLCTIATVLLVSATLVRAEGPTSSFTSLVQESVRPASDDVPEPWIVLMPSRFSMAADDVLLASDATSDSWTSALLTASPGNAGSQGTVWGGAEFLYWSLKPGNTPPLATSGTLASLGALGPGTTVLYGGDQDTNWQPGARFTLGTWLDAGQTYGVEANFFFLNSSSDTFNVSSPGTAGSLILARPFFNVITGLQDSQLVSFDDIVGGGIGITAGSFLQGAQLNGLTNLCSSCPCPTPCCPQQCCPPGCVQEIAYRPYAPSGHRVDLVSGLRYMDLGESLHIRENLTFLPTAPNPPFVPGSTIDVTDSFETRNQFVGGQLGLRAERWSGAWFVNATGLVAVGSTHQEVRINGTTVFGGLGGPPIVQQGGLLALPTNIGTYSRDRFSVIPEVGINVGRQLSDSVRVYAGYSLMYWSSVVRPGDQIDFGINPTQLPTAAGPGVLVGPARPAFNFHETDFWAHGVNVGLQISR